MRGAFEELGLAPIDVPLDAQALRAHPDASPFSWGVAGKANVVARWQATEPVDGRSLILNGHIDVVSPEPITAWSAPPFAATRDGDWLQGRGAGDMKAGLVAIVELVRALRRLGLAPRAPVELQSVVEEECGGNGALACARRPHSRRRGHHRAHRRSDPALQVGVLWFGVRVTGRPAHAGDAPEGQNAIEATFPIISALRALEAELNAEPPAPYDAYPHPINLNVGRIRGGDWPSTVAGESVTDLRLALYPGEAVDDLRSRVEETVAAVSERPRPRRPRGRGDLRRLRVRGLYARGRCPDRHRRRQGDRADQRNPGRANRIDGDDRCAQLRPHRGSPALCFGPRAENVHGVDERVLLPSMVETAQVLGLLIRDWCGLTTDRPENG